MNSFSLRSLALFPLAAVLAGCGMSSSTLPGANPTGGSAAISGILHGGPSPVVGATVKLWVTAGTGYGDTANNVASTTSGSDGGFTLSLPIASANPICPAGQYAYVTAAGGSGGTGTNSAILLMVPVGACSSNYSAMPTTVGASTTYANSYSGTSLWMDEITTAASAYALDGFMTVSGTNVYIDAPANNLATATQSATAPTAAGLAHAFANALALVSNSSGQPKATYNNVSGGGVVPTAELYTMGNILQACVNSTGPTGAAGSNTATANDGSACGMLFSLTTPPVSSPTVPSNTLAAILYLAKYPNPQGTTWNSTCTASTGGTNTATKCLFNIQPSTAGPYAGGLTSAPPDWALAVVYQGGYGAGGSTPACAVTGTSGTACFGLNYPYYVATDYADNVYVLNQDASTNTTQNILGFGFDGTNLFATAQDSTTYYAIKMIATDLAGHVMGPNSTLNSAATNNLRVFSTGTYSGGATAGTVVASPSTGTSSPIAIAIDPNNAAYFISSSSGGSLRRAAVTGGTNAAPTYTVTALTPGVTPGGGLQISLDSSLNVYVEESSTSGTAKMDYAVNGGTTAAPTYTTAFETATFTANTNVLGSEGVVTDSVGNAYAMADKGIFKVTKGSGSITVGSAITVPQLYSSAFDAHFAYLDGAGNVITPDNANGSVVSGIAVYDVADGGLALGTYRGCYVVSKACGTSAASSPAFSPRAAAIDSAGTVWVVSGASHTLTEYIGAAAPTWPALANVKYGKPQ